MLGHARAEQEEALKTLSSSFFFFFLTRSYDHFRPFSPEYSIVRLRRFKRRSPNSHKTAQSFPFVALDHINEPF